MLKPNHFASIQVAGYKLPFDVYVEKVDPNRKKYLLIVLDGEYSSSRMAVRDRNIEAVKEQRLAPGDLRKWDMKHAMSFLKVEMEEIVTHVRALSSVFSAEAGNKWNKHRRGLWKKYTETLSYFFRNRRPTDLHKALEERKQLQRARILPHQLQLSTSSRRRLRKKHKVRSSGRRSSSHYALPEDAFQAYELKPRRKGSVVFDSAAHKRARQKAEREKREAIHKRRQYLREKNSQKQ